MAETTSTSTNGTTTSGTIVGTTIAGTSTPAVSTTTTAARKPAARKTTARKATATRPSSRSTSTRRTSAGTAAKAPSPTTAAEGRSIAERAALVGVGATVEARDRILDLAGEFVGRYGTSTGVKRELKRSRRELDKDIRRFERKGTSTRNQIERDVRKARTRVERELRGRRRDAERLIRRGAGAVEHEAETAERQAARRRNIVSEGVATVSNRVEDAVQIGVATGERVATLAKDRVSAIA